MTPFEYLLLAASGNTFEICSGNFKSLYTMPGGPFTYLLLSENSSKNILAKALSV